MASCCYLEVVKETVSFLHFSSTTDPIDPIVTKKKYCPEDCLLREEGCGRLDKGGRKKGEEKERGK